jgi:hypothetical protein
MQSGGAAATGGEDVTLEGWGAAGGGLRCEMEAEAEVEEGAGAEAEAMTLGELWTECDAVGCVGTLGGMLCLTI